MTGEVFNSLILYFNKIPELVCTHSDGSEQPCSWYTACVDQNPDIRDFKPDYSKRESLDNFITRTNLICAPKQYIGYFGVSMTLGTAVGSIFLPYMADKFGRKSILLLSLVMSIPALAFTINLENVAIAYTVVFFWGFTSISRYTILFVWASELFPSGHGMYAITGLRAMIGITLFSMNFYFMFLSQSIDPAL